MSDGLPTDTIDRGEGPAIVFAHGMELDRRLFEPQVDALCDDYRTIAYDLRARTAAGTSEFDLYDLVDDLVAVLDAAAVDRALFVGMSMGGFTAVRAALRIPDRLHGIVLIGSSCVPFAADEVAEWRTAYEPLRERETVGASRARADAELHFSAATMRRRPELVDVWTERIAGRSGAATWNEFCSWAYQDDVREAFARVGLPVMIVHGQEDPAVPLAHALETFALARDGRLLVLPYAAHAPNLEFPGAVNEAIRMFAERVIGR